MLHPDGPIVFTIPGEATAFARAGSAGKRRYTPKKQSDYMGIIRLFASRAMGSRPPLEGPVSVRMTAFSVTPASWSKKKRETTTWRTSKPDLDNTYKLCADSLNNIVWLDDAQVACLHVEKLYAAQASLVVCIMPL